MHIGIFLPNWIGDVVMATPTLRALRTHFGPTARLTGIGRPLMSEVLAATPWLDEMVPFDPRGSKLELRTQAVVQRLRQQRFDTAVLLTNSFRTALMAWRSGARQRVGYARGGRSLWLSDRLYQAKTDGRFVPSPVLDDYLRLAYHLGCPTESPRLELATLDEDERAADETWRRLGIEDDDSVVVVNTGGAFGAAKQWPVEYFAALTQRMAMQLNLRMVIVCGPAEREAAQRIVDLARHDHVRSIAEEPLSIGLTKACVRRSDLMITTDSGPRHFAAAFGVPVVTLFGPTHIRWSETHYANAAHLQVDVPCGPCQQRVCPLVHHRCMRDLSVQDVYDAVVEMLSRRRSSCAA